MSWSERDLKVIWHPYTQMKTAPSPLGIVRAQGATLYTEDGRTLFDGISSWWVNLHGHSHPQIAARISAQATQLEHVMFAGFTHPPAVELAEKLLAILPGKMSRIFYSDNGSTAVEVALKMALQYWRNRGESQRRRFYALEHAYHGDTVGAMSVSARGLFTAPFEDLLFEVVRIPANVNALSKALEESDSVAGFIYEPLLQAAGGMRIHSPESVEALLSACKSRGVLLIADEVMTGFYRTGKCFASEYLPTQPDLICLSKGVTGGALPLGVTACRDEIFNAFLSDDRSRAFFHGHSFTANPLACAASLASLELLERPETLASVVQIAQHWKAFVLDLAREDFPISGARSLGTLVAFELKNESHDYLDPIGLRFAKAVLARGLLLRPLGNTVYVLPPYCSTSEELQWICETIKDTLREITSHT